MTACPSNIDGIHDLQWYDYGACNSCGDPIMPIEERLERGIIKPQQEGFLVMSDITKMSDEEIHEQIRKLQNMQPPPREAKKPRRVGEPKEDNPNRKKSWKDLLND